MHIGSDKGGKLQVNDPFAIIVPAKTWVPLVAQHSGGGACSCTVAEAPASAAPAAKPAVDVSSMEKLY